MSGHSKWANIKNRKESQDKKRSVVFTKAAKEIMAAVRIGGGNTNPEANFLLAGAIAKAKELNVPKENIERLLGRLEEKKLNLSQMLLEGYTSSGSPLVVEVETDNKNRILTDIRMIFRKYGARMVDSGSVMFMFDRVGEIKCERNLGDDEALELIGDEVVDICNNRVFVVPDKTKEFVEKCAGKGMAVVSAGLIMRPKNYEDVELDRETVDLFDELEDNDDVVGVYTTLNRDEQKI